MPDNLETLVERISSRLSSAEQIEDDKIEIKRDWYNLQESIELNEFLKDIVAIANTPGVNGYLIIGIDKDGKLFDAPFSKSNLRDLSDVHNLLVKHVDLPFRITIREIHVRQETNNITLTILEIPPSIEKPHFIRKYISKKGNEIQNYIPIRKTTGVYPANRSDVEFMYYDRKNIEPQYDLAIIAHKPKMSVNAFGDSTTIEFQLSFQNSGRRPIAIAESVMTVYAAPELKIPKDTMLRLDSYAESSIQERRSYLTNRFLKVPSNQIESLMVSYLIKCENTFGQILRDATSLKFSVSATDINGNIYQSDIIQRSH